MLRKKFGGPRVAAAKQIVTLKPSAPEAVTEEATKEISSVAAVIVVGPSSSNSAATSSQQITESAAPRIINHLSNQNESTKTPIANDESVENNEEIEEEPVVISPFANPTTRVRTFSQTSMFSTVSVASAIKRKKRTFERDEELDAARFTMADLIDWRPKTENTLRSKWKEAEKKFKEEGFTVKKEKKEEATETEIGPKVKMDEEGNVIIDEESLVVRRNPENSLFETVDDDLVPKKLNSLSFKRNYARTTTWSELETELFYEVLSATGTDFSLMQEYLPFKTRADLKKKFNKEEKTCMGRIDRTLRNPSILDDKIIKERMEKYLVSIDREKEEKLIAKEKKKAKRAPKKVEAEEESTTVENTQESTATQESAAEVEVLHVEPAKQKKKKKAPKEVEDKQESGTIESKQESAEGEAESGEPAKSKNKKVTKEAGAKKKKAVNEDENDESAKSKSKKKVVKEVKEKKPAPIRKKKAPKEGEPSTLENGEEESAEIVNDESAKSKGKKKAVKEKKPATNRKKKAATEAGNDETAESNQKKPVKEKPTTTRKKKAAPEVEESAKIVSKEVEAKRATLRKRKAPNKAECEEPSEEKV